MGVCCFQLGNIVALSSRKIWDQSRWPMGQWKIDRPIDLYKLNQGRSSQVIKRCWTCFKQKKKHASKVPPIGQARGSVEVVCMEKAHGWPRCFDSEKSIDSCLVAVGKNKFFFFLLWFVSLRSQKLMSWGPLWWNVWDPELHDAKGPESFLFFSVCCCI